MAKEKGKQEDLRQRRSKRHMSQALMELMEERSFGDISVVDICNRAMVHRTTFYSHFKDKNMLLRHVLHELHCGFRKSCSADREPVSVQEYILDEFSRVLSFLKEHSAFYLSGLEGDCVGLRLVEDSVAEGLSDCFQSSGPESGDRRIEADVMSRFYAGALMSMVHWWLKGGMTVGESKLLEQFRGMLPAGSLL